MTQYSEAGTDGLRNVRPHLDHDLLYNDNEDELAYMKTGRSKGD